MIKPGIYKHYKGQIYKVIGIAQDVTNGSFGEIQNEMANQYVVYTHTVSGKLYIRKISEFESDVTGSGQTVKRFTLLYETL